MKILPGETVFHRVAFLQQFIVVIPHKKGNRKGKDFDVSYNLFIGQLYFFLRSASIIATFVRPGKTRRGESGENS